MNSRNRRSVKKQVAQRDGAFCVWCSADLDLNAPDGDPSVASLDHVVTQKNGGSWWVGNLVLACLDCNSRRGHATMPKWVAHCEAQGYNLYREALEDARRRVGNPLARAENYLAMRAAEQQAQQQAACLRRQRKKAQVRAHQQAARLHRQSANSTPLALAA